MGRGSIEKAVILRVQTVAANVELDGSANCKAPSKLPAGMGPIAACLDVSLPELMAEDLGYTILRACQSLWPVVPLHSTVILSSKPGRVVERATCKANDLQRPPLPSCILHDIK